MGVWETIEYIIQEIRPCSEEHQSGTFNSWDAAPCQRWMRGGLRETDPGQTELLQTAMADCNGRQQDHNHKPGMGKRAQIRLDGQVRALV